MTNKHEAVENTVQAKPGVITLNRLKSLENWRAFIHQITPVIVTTLVSVGIITNSQVMLWVPLIFAIIDPLLSTINSTDKMRKIVYGVTGLLSSGGLVAGLSTGLSTQADHVAPIISVGLTVLSAFMARFYTLTTTVVSKEA